MPSSSSSYPPLDPSILAAAAAQVKPVTALPSFLGTPATPTLTPTPTPTITPPPVPKVGAIKELGGAFMRGTPGSAWGKVGGAVGVGSKAIGGIPYALAGAGAGALINHFWDDPNSSLDNIAASAARWGGAGAAFGPWGAAGGALFGGVKGWWDSRDEGDKAVSSELSTQQRRLTELLTQVGASDDLKTEAVSMLQLQASQATDRGQVKAVYDALAAQLPAAIAQDKDTQTAQKFRESNMAAVQSWIAPMLQQAIDRQAFYADAQAQQMEQAAAMYADPTLQHTTRALAQSVRGDAANANQAQLSQMMLAPQLYADPRIQAGLAGQAQQAAGQTTTATAEELALAQLLGVG